MTLPTGKMKNNPSTAEAGTSGKTSAATLVFGFILLAAGATLLSLALKRATEKDDTPTSIEEQENRERRSPVPDKEIGRPSEWKE